MLQTSLNILSLCIALAAVETLHGVFRAAVLVPRVGKKTALKLGVFSGSALGFLVCLYFVPRMDVTGPLALLGVGLFAALFMVTFDLVLARVLLRRSFARSLAGLNPKTGNFLVFGLLFLAVCPLLVSALETIVFD